ncbi:MAG: DEAD/DEAH box helicase [Planctomycetia bacterium]|nr:DEAD/DEAH box helicase [Planctomycetia bacterium]
MIVLHAGMEDGRLLLWGESPAANSHAPREKKRESPRAAALPYDAGAKRLAGALETVGSVGEGWKRSRGRDVTRTIWLPTRAGTPIPSSPMISDVEAGRSAPALAPWSVTCVGLPWPDATALLCFTHERPVLAPGVLASGSLSFLAQLLRHAGALVTRQQFLPGLRQEQGKWFARWEPVLSGGEGTSLAELARQMPPAVRAIAADGEANAPSRPAVEIVNDAIGRLVDCLVRGSRQAAAAEGAPRSTKRQARRFDSLHDQWLFALGSPDGKMQAGDSELAELAAQVESWRRPVHVTTRAPFRLCFRLEEPPPDEAQGSSADVRRPVRAGDWYVRFLLQAADDPSLLLTAEKAWNADKRADSLWRRAGLRPQELLLSTLGQAAGICPRIESSLKTQRPAGYGLDAAGAFEFLSETAMTLEQAGFRVLLPAWWTRKGTKVRLAVHASVKGPPMKSAGALSLDEVVTFQWQVALGDQVLSRDELEALARFKQPLVNVRGQWVQMSAEEIEAALDFWKRQSAVQATVRDAVKMALGAEAPMGPLAFGSIKTTGWIDDFLKQLQDGASLEELPPPTGFVGTLRPYQARGYSWLAFLRRFGLGACLADDMGLGKTVQTLALLQREWESGNRSPVLLVCPTSVVANWQKEAARFTPDLPVLVHHGLARARSDAFLREAKRHALVISSYALLHRDREHFGKVDWGGVILDEAQNVKNPAAKQSQAARSLRAEYRLALTGTPVENHVGDLWSIMEFLNAGFLGTQADFRRRFFIPIQSGGDPEAAGRLRRITGPFVLRRLKTDKSIIADLPEKLEMKVFCSLTKEQASLYQAAVNEARRAIESADGIQRKGLILALLSKLKQICNHPAHFLGDNSELPGRSGKLARLTEMAEEVLDGGDRALIFTQFSEMGDLLQKHLEETFGREVLFLHGSLSKRRRDALVERFQSDAGPPLFVLSLKAGGTGLNLTRASHVFHFDRWWNPAVENQATDRAFRIGQTRNVQVHKFLCAGTCEEKIDELIESKLEIAGQVVSAGEGWITKLSNNELKEIFALRNEALADDEADSLRRRPSRRAAAALQS